jgi:hypothetical protein
VVEPQVPDGYTLVMGEAVVTLDCAERPYTTYDFSIGALDASVQLRKSYDCSGQGSCQDTGQIELSMNAYPDTNPDAEAGVFNVSGVCDGVPDGPVAPQKVTVMLKGAQGWDGTGLMSKGTAVMKLTAVKCGKDGSQS